MALGRRTSARGRGPRGAAWREALTPFARTFTALLVLATFALVAARLSAMAREDRRFQVEPAALLDELRPSWLPAGILAGVRAELSRLEPLSVFDPEFTEKLRAGALVASPWIEDVRSVERLYPNRVAVEIELRRPVVVVAHGARRYLLDGEARVIHDEPAHLATRFGYPLLEVVGARPEAAPRLGLPHGDPEVFAAVQVAAELLELEGAAAKVLWSIEPVALEIRRSILGSAVAAGEVHLRTAAGVLVEWGRARRSPSFGLTDPPPRRKIEHLMRILEAFPGLAGLEEVRLNFDHPHYRPAGGGLIFLKDAPAAAESPRDP